MVEHNIKKLPVTHHGQLVGIITTSDLIRLEPKLVEKVANL